MSRIHQMAAAMIVCGLLPAAAWTDTPKSPRSARIDEVPAGSEQGRQLEEPEIGFDSARGQVTLRVSPRYLNNVRIPFHLRERLTVYENGVRQPAVDVDVEYSPITLAVLVENGGRSQQLNDSIAADGWMVVRPLLNLLDDQDRLGIFAYDDSVRTVVDFDTPHDQWSIALGRLKPKFSEANFYDATSAVLDRLASVDGRKALLIVSTGIDTFSRTGFAELVAQAKQAKTPIYVFNLGSVARRRLSGSGGLLARVDWAACQRQLEQLAEASGGRTYSDAGGPDVQGLYEEIVENLKVRYVLTYSPRSTSASLRRTVEVAVIDSTSGEATPVARSSRRGTDVNVIAEGTYTLRGAPAAVSAAAESEQRQVDASR